MISRVSSIASADRFVDFVHSIMFEGWFMGHQVNPLVRVPLLMDGFRTS